MFRRNGRRSSPVQCEKRVPISNGDGVSSQMPVDGEACRWKIIQESIKKKKKNTTDFLVRGAAGRVHNATDYYHKRGGWVRRGPSTTDRTASDENQ